KSGLSAPPFPYEHCIPGSSRSINVTLCPERCNCSALSAPMMPAPTTRIFMSRASLPCLKRGADSAGGSQDFGTVGIPGLNHALGGAKRTQAGHDPVRFASDGRTDARDTQFVGIAQFR